MAAEVSRPVQTEVIAQHLSGKRKAHIANDLSLSRVTVNRILEKSGVNEISAKTRALLLSGAQNAAIRIVKDAKKDSQVGFELLDRLKILPKSAGAQNTFVSGGQVAVVWGGENPTWLKPANTTNSGQAPAEESLTGPDSQPIDITQDS